ncbi:MAG: ECF transporter S component [Ruminococcaceae bacterium]|nr:ECF transporter S component [Oscillospiraceae bacterium]
MRNLKIKQMATVALLMALVVVMQFVSGMIPPVGGFSISLVLIPVVLGSALYGPAVGSLLGGTFGVIVFINCVTGADPGGAMVFQANPVLCFVVVMAKGILAGLASGWTYRLLRRKNAYIAMLVAAIVCPLINTGIFVLCMFAFFKNVLSVWAGGTNLLTYVLTGLVVANFLPELGINMVFSPAGQRIVHVVHKNKD